MLQQGLQGLVVVPRLGHLVEEVQVPGLLGLQQVPLLLEIVDVQEAEHVRDVVVFLGQQVLQRVRLIDVGREKSSVAYVYDREEFREDVGMEVRADYEVEVRVCSEGEVGVQLLVFISGSVSRHGKAAAVEIIWLDVTVSLWNRVPLPFILLYLALSFVIWEFSSY